MELYQMWLIMVLYQLCFFKQLCFFYQPNYMYQLTELFINCYGTASDQLGFFIMFLNL